jgi:hypothetical protein
MAAAIPNLLSGCCRLLAAIVDGGRMAIISAEGGLFDILAGRYSNGVPALDVWLKGHAGDPLRIDRKGRRNTSSNPR